MENPDGIAGQVAAAGGPGGLNLRGHQALDFASQVAATRAAWHGPEWRLLVFDNLEDPVLLDTWRPTGGGARVLITSRDSTWPAHSGVQTIPLPPLEVEPALDLLLTPLARKRGVSIAALLPDEPTRAAAVAICTALGGLPLALALAAAYLEATGTSLVR